MKYSICIPVRNSVDYLKFAIQSVLDQTYSQFELIVVDNNSDRSVRDIIKDFNDPRIRYHRHQQTLPMAENWNSCFKLASGEWVSILHDDDRLKIDYLENVDRVLARHSGVGHIFGRVEYINKYGLPIGKMKPSTGPFGLYYRDKYMSMISEGYFYLCPGVCTRRNIALQLKGFSDWLSLHMDYEFYVRIGLETKVFAIDSLVGEYRIHENLERWDSPQFTRHSVEDSIAWIDKIHRSYLPPLNNWSNRLAKTVFNIGVRSIIRILISGDHDMARDFAHQMLFFKEDAGSFMSLFVLKGIALNVPGISNVILFRRRLLNKKSLAELATKQMLNRDEEKSLFR